MAQLEIASFERTGADLLIRFNSEQDAKRMEQALGVAFPQDEKPVVEPLEPEPAQPLPTVRVHEKVKWHDGMVLNVWVTNETAADKILSVGLATNSVIDEIWGGTHDIDDGEYVIESDKPTAPGESWDFTIKLKGTDHSYEFLNSIYNQPEPESEPTVPQEVEQVAAPLAEAAPSTDAPSNLVYAPTLDIAKDAKKNILDNLGGVYEGGWEWENIEIVDDPDGPCLRTHMGKDLYVGDEGKRRGGGFDTRTIKATHAVLEYDLRFKPGFDPVKGGKLPGLMAGDSPSGHKKADNGISARMMWRRNAEGELYLYFPDMKVSHGDSIGRGNFHFDTSGEWRRVKQEVRLNDVGQNNGFIKVWYDNVPVIEATDLRLRTKGSVLLEGIMHTIFFGGGNRSWAAARDEWVDTRNFRIYEL